MYDRLRTTEDCEIVLKEIESIDDLGGMFKKSVAQARNVLSKVCRIPNNIFPFTGGGVYFVYADEASVFREFLIIGNDIHTCYIDANDPTCAGGEDNISIKSVCELVKNMDWKSHWGEYL